MQKNRIFSAGLALAMTCLVLGPAYAGVGNDASHADTATASSAIAMARSNNNEPTSPPATSPAASPTTDGASASAEASPSSPAASSSALFSPDQVEEIGKIIDEHLLNNPEILVKVGIALRNKQADQAQKMAMVAVKNNIDQLFSDPRSPTTGPADAAVQVVEFFDYQCGHCKAMHPVIQALLKNNPNVQFIFKEFPIFGGASKEAAQAALAAATQGKYYPFHAALFSSSDPLDSNVISKIAKSVNIDTDLLEKEKKAQWVDEQLNANIVLAQALNLEGTPAFIIANREHTQFRFIPGAISQADLEQKIASVISPKNSTGSAAAQSAAPTQSEAQSASAAAPANNANG